MIFEKVYEDAVLPTLANEGDAGWDLYSYETWTLYPEERHLFPTGVKLIKGAIDGGVGFITPRSGLAHKVGVTVLNAPGTIDSGFEGMIYVNLVNLGTNVAEIEAGNRIGQLVVLPLLASAYPVGGDGTVRGEGGHGSSGR